MHYQQSTKAQCLTIHKEHGNEPAGLEKLLKKLHLKDSSRNFCRNRRAEAVFVYGVRAISTNV
jgi:hypothetical protein